MTYPPDPPPVSWTVTGTQETTQVTDGGQAVRGYRIYFRTGNGATGSVFVPETRYLPDNVRSLLMAAAQNADAIAQLSSGG